MKLRPDPLTAESLKGAKRLAERYPYATATMLMKPIPTAVAVAKAARPLSLDVLEQRTINGDEQAAEALQKRVNAAIRKSRRDPLSRLLLSYLVKASRLSIYGAANDLWASRFRDLPPLALRTARQWAQNIIKFAAHEGQDLSQMTQGYAQQKLRERKRVKLRRMEALEKLYRATHKSRNLSFEEEEHLQRLKKSLDGTTISNSDRRRGTIEAVTPRLKTIIKGFLKKTV